MSKRIASDQAAKISERDLSSLSGLIAARRRLAAQKNFMTSAEYMRRSILDRIKEDGIDPTQLAGAA